MFCCLRNFVLLKFIECFKLLVSQNNNVCVCVCVGVGVGVGVWVSWWVGGSVRACVRACVCVYIVIVKYFPCI